MEEKIMTHTLHRRMDIDIGMEDFVVLCMASQKHNDKGAAEKLRKIFKLVGTTNPDNLADDNLGGRFTGHIDEQVLDHMGDKAYIGAAFSDRARLKDALQKLKEADLGMSVVVSGNYEVVFDVLKEIDLKPHTVNMSLGVFGNKEVLPGKEMLGISTMCGHGMVTVNCIEDAIEQVSAGAITAEDGGKKLASTCTCGIFNPKRCEKILQAISK
jgi:hypothetical protein